MEDASNPFDSVALWVDSGLRRFAAMEARLTRLPGHEKNSWGYHGDDGLAYGGDKNSGTTYGEPFGGMSLAVDRFHCKKKIDDDY